ncbi:MAG: hypothetical protein ABFC84_10790 [Veillonellales bacterium]
MVAGNKRLARTALLLALTLLFQSLRLLLPLPVFATTFIIGSLVNACLLVAVETTGLRGALLISLLAPCVAYFQQLLPLPVFILPVAIGNILYSRLFWLGGKWKSWQSVSLAALGKTLFLYVSFVWLLSFIAIPPKIAAGILFVMSWPQLVTTLAGGFLATIVSRRVKRLTSY